MEKVCNDFFLIFKPISLFSTRSSVNLFQRNTDCFVFFQPFYVFESYIYLYLNLSWLFLIHNNAHKSGTLQTRQVSIECLILYTIFIGLVLIRQWKKHTCCNNPMCFWWSLFSYPAATYCHTNFSHLYKPVPEPTQLLEWNKVSRVTAWVFCKQP